MVSQKALLKCLKSCKLRIEDTMTVNILKLEFKSDSHEMTVKKLMPTIEFYRSEGRSLPDIYTALCEAKALSKGNASPMSLSTFRNGYYQNRIDSATQGTKKKTTKEREKKATISSAKTPVKSRKSRS